MRRIETANVVLVATNLNPSILTEVWLVRHGIIREGAVTGEWVFTPLLVKVPTAEFEIVAVPERLQFTISKPMEAAQSLVEERVGRIVDLLPHTPYTALGLNFHWTADTTALEQFAAGLRRMFVKDGSALYGEFAGRDARYGAYLSKDALGFRLRVDIKPIRGERNGVRCEGLRYAFNFHKVLEPEREIEQIHAALLQWTQARQLSEGIFESTTGWMSDEH